MEHSPENKKNSHNAHEIICVRNSQPKFPSVSPRESVADKDEKTVSG